MSLQDVTLVELQASQSVEAATNGSIDAIIYYQPYIYEIEDRLGDNGSMASSKQSTILRCHSLPE